jgi:hypothetical protein
MVDRILPLLEARRAHELSQSGHTRRKVVRGIRANACCSGPIAGRMTFTLADQVFAGTDKSFVVEVEGANDDTRPFRDKRV